MHLFLENIIPTLVKLWMGAFKGLGPGNEDYEIEGQIWEVIGDETANATHTIPSAFV